MSLRLTNFRQWRPDDSVPGVVLLTATMVAVVWRNCAGRSYVDWWSAEFGWAGAGLRMDLRHWVTDAVMTVFFFAIGLELKAELTRGRLRHPRHAVVPIVAAVGGAIVPAGLFLVQTEGGYAARGWGVPMATDPAFALGVFAVCARRMPSGLRTLLLAIATVDDALAVLVIAFGYSAGIRWDWVAGVMVGCLVVVGMRRAGVERVWAYVPVGIGMWFATLHSGIHATFTGVVLAMLTPAGRVTAGNILDELLRYLTPISAFVVLPVFALADAGVEVTARSAGAWDPRVMWAVFVSLLIGKFVGVTGSIALTTATRLGRLPPDVGTGHIIALGFGAGLGFTVALLVAGLAYSGSVPVESATVGVFAASVVAAVAAGVSLAVTGRHNVNNYAWDVASGG